MAEKRIAEIVRYLERRVAESGLAEPKVVLFGSRARGMATEESDVDVAIISPSFRGKDAFKRARLTKDVEIRAMRRFRLPFDIVTLTPEEYEGEAMIGDIIRATSNAVL
jgi:predicted nucleotidyltransferase